MATNNNLQDFLTDIANAIRTKTQTTEPINAQDFSTKILSIQTGGGGTTVKNLLDATQKAAYLFVGYTGNSVDNLIAYDDTANVKSFESMFENSSVTTIPQLNTSNVTNMNYMFEACANLTSIPQLNTSNVKNMSSMFYQCKSLTSIPLLDTSKVTNMSYMLAYCKNLSSIPLLNTSKVTDMSYMFYNCNSLTSIPLLDTSKVTDISSIFYGCKALTTVPALDASHITNMNSMFSGCSSLKSILMTGMKVKFDISSSTQFEESDLVTILNNLATVTTTQTLTMGATNLAKLTDEEKAIATNKGWTLA